MRLMKLRAMGAGCCLVATAVLLPASTARGDAIPSQLVAAPDLATAQLALSDARALEWLTRLGVSSADAARLVAASREVQVEYVLDQYSRVTRTEGQLTLTTNPRAWLESLGLASHEAVLLATELSGAELAWLGTHPAEATAYVGKIVGMNWKGFLILLLPLIGVAWVAAAGTGEAASVAAGALVVGLVFVLFAEPAFIFGSRDDVIM